MKACACACVHVHEHACNTDAYCTYIGTTCNSTHFTNLFDVFAVQLIL